MPHEKGSIFPMELSLHFSDAIRALASNDFPTAWSATKQALDKARGLKATLDGGELATRISELLDVLDETLRVAYGDDWSRSIRLPSEVPPNKAELRCAFCRKTIGQVAKLFSGPRFYVCDECLALCNEIVVSVPPQSGK